MPVRRLFGLAALALAFGCKAATDSPTPTSIAASPDPITLVSIGQTQQITASVKDQNGNTMSGQTITYSSNASGVATVSTSGLVTAVSSGNATITLAAAGLTEQVSVAVNQTASAINKTQGDGQTALENSTLPTQLRATVVDALGNAVAGVTVTFTIQGGGTLNDSTVNTNAQGHALVTWTLGSSANNQSVTATAGALNTTFTATAVSASSLVITKYVGDGQTALVGYATNIRPAVRVTTFGTSNGVPGVNVTFAVTGGGGSVQGTATVATNAQGYAQVQNWVVGGSPGANAMTATGAGTFPGGATVTFNATGQAQGFNIVIRNVGPAFSPAVQVAFDSAEARWERIIYGDLQDGQLTATDACSMAGTVDDLNEVVDDIIILARFDSIDGPGLVLGNAGDCGYLRNNGGLPALGRMVFDTADVASMITNGILNDVILHEMGHVLGFSGGRFDLVFGNVNRDCIALQTSGTPPNVVSQDTHYSCAIGRAMFDSIGGSSYTGGLKVPLENCASGVPSSCGGGTYNGHWREPTFGNELMTGYINAGANPMSVLTIAVMGELGYTVNYAAAAAYTRTFTAPAAFQGTWLELGNDIYVAPVTRFIDPNGRVVHTVRRQ
jgi:hypothetical protein